MPNPNPNPNPNPSPSPNPEQVYAGSARRGRAEATGGHVFELQLLQRALLQVVVAGISEISRAIISRKEESEKHASEQGRECFQLLVEGVGLQALIGIRGQG